MHSKYDFGHKNQVFQPFYRNGRWPNFLEKSIESVLSISNKNLFRNTNGFFQEMLAKSFFDKKMQNGIYRLKFEVLRLIQYTSYYIKMHSIVYGELVAFTLFTVLKGVLTNSNDLSQKFFWKKV